MKIPRYFVSLLMSSFFFSPSPSDDTEKLRIQEVASMGSPEGTYVPIPTDLTGQAAGMPGTSGQSGVSILMPIS